MFPGFYRPKANFFKVPNDWFDLWIQVRQETGQSRIAGLLKATEYTLKWSWGYQNYDQPVRISYRNFQFGMLRGGRRHDRGAGLSSRGVQNALARLLELNILERHESENGNGGQAYLPHLQPPEEDEDAFLGSMADEDAPNTWKGFERPETNYFEVPALWTDLTCGVTSAAVILAVEYFFRHTWGWHRNQEATRPTWMTVEEVAAGRRDRTGERYDDGTGYTVRSIRPALEEAVSQGWLVWRVDERTGRKQYALHLKGMAVSDEGEWLGHQEAAEANDRGCAPVHAPPLEEEITAVPPSPAPEADTDHATEIARLQAQVATLTKTVAQLQAVIHQALGPTALEGLEPVPALASLVEDSKAAGEDSKALGEESKAPQGRCHSASYTDSASESEQTPPPNNTATGGAGGDGWHIAAQFDSEQTAAFDDLLRIGVRPQAAAELVRDNARQLGRIQSWIDYAEDLVRDDFEFTNLPGFVVAGLKRNEAPLLPRKPYRYAALTDGSTAPKPTPPAL